MSNFISYLPLAAGIMLSPMPIMAMIVLSATGRARGGGTAFLMGWWLSIVGFMAVAVLLFQRFRGHDTEDVSLITIIIQFVCALALFWIAWNNWSTRPKTKTKIPPPHWIEKFSKHGQIRLFFLGGIMDFANVKNLPIMVTAAFAISDSAGSLDEGMMHAMGFATLASVGMIVPWFVGLLRGERSHKSVERVRDWLYHYNNVIMAVLFFYMGIMLLSAALTNIALYSEQSV